jgi:AraC-like DNA-binding protein
MNKIPSWPLRLDAPPRSLTCYQVRHPAAHLRWRQPGWAITLIDGRGTVAAVDGSWHLTIVPGCFCAIAPGEEMVITIQPGWRQWECRFTPQRGTHESQLPGLLPPGSDAAWLRQTMIHLVAQHPHDPSGACAALWHLLRRVAAAPCNQEGPQLIDRALALIAEDSTLGVADLARRLTCSPPTLYRAFSARFGLSPLTYLHQRRATLARDLLTGTALPIAAIAAQVGLPDLQHFNKFVRRQLGAPPSRIRSGN